VRGFALSVEAKAGADGVAVTLLNPAEVRTAFGGEDGAAMDERFQPGTATESTTVADAIVFAASQDAATVSEMDRFRRDELADSIR